MGCNSVISTSEKRPGGEAASDHFNHHQLSKVSATRMWMLWALATMLAMQAGALDVLEPPPVGSLPSLLSSVQYVEPPPLPLPSEPAFRSSSAQNSSPHSKKSPKTPEGQCAPASKYFLSAEKLNEYLNATIPLEIEKLVKCKKVNLIGALGEVINTMENTGVLEMLDVTSLLDMGSGGIGGIIGTNSKGDKSPKLPSLSKVGETADKLGVGGLLSSGAGQSPVKGLLDSAQLPDLQPVNDVAGSAKNLKDSALGKVKDVLPAEATKAFKSALGNTELKEILLGLNIDSVNTVDLNSTITKDEIDVKAKAVATIGGKGVAGAVINILGFEVHLEMNLKIAVSTNSTQCVSLDIEETNINANKVTLRILDTLTDTASLPVSLPLKDTVPKVLSVELQKNVDNSESCGIVLSDFNECKNSTGLFQFRVKSAKTEEQGLSILYCVEALFNKTAVPVPGGRLPPHPKNATVSIIMSSTMIKTAVKQNAKLSSAKSDDLEAKITKTTFNFQKDSVRIIYWTTIKRDGESFAKGESALIMKLAGKVSSGKMTVNVEVSRTEYNVNPPELKDTVKDVMLQVQKKFSLHLTESAKNWNIPWGVSPYPVNGDVTVMPSEDLVAVN